MDQNALSQEKNIFKTLKRAFEDKGGIFTV